MNCRATFLVFQIILLFLCLGCSFNNLKAQADTMDSVRFYLDPTKPYDSLRFRRETELLSGVAFTYNNLQELNSLANGYARSKNLDTAFVLKYYILQVLSSVDHEKAIVYGRSLYDELSAYKGANAGILKGRILYWHGSLSLSIPLAQIYSPLTLKTLERDMDEMEKNKLVLKHDGKYFANIAALNRMIARRRGLGL